ncbi:cellulose binding domain-containing protein [uncultured Cocleimonas sp.]|uniref:cellulose binding domain-containing protein n=1 Tax=uncultured Cocleimonas sp. TaxID=1051587 RepID=UPI0026352C00|nr:cellulose binding domain-containing protein [uncultured Cocleimonas sp.]
MTLSVVIQFLIAKNRVKTADSFDQKKNKSSISELKINRFNIKLIKPSVFLKSKLFSKLCNSIFLLFSLFVLSSSVQAACQLTKTIDWGASFQADITVTNESSSTVNGWEVNWSFADGSSIYGFWNANITGSNPYTATDLGWNASIAPNQSQTFTIQVNGGGDLVAPGLIGDLCGPAIISQSLTIVKEVVNDNGGTAVVSDFGLTTNAGALTFDTGSPNGITTTYTSSPISVNEGTYSLVESDVTDYTEGTWSCTGATGTVVDTFNAGSVEIASGENVTCTIVNNDIAPIVVPPVMAGPVSGSVCNADLLGNAQAYRAIDWTHNDNGGTNTGATIADTAIFAAGTAENLSNMDAYINAYDLLVDRAFIPSTLDTSKYISYTFTTTALSGVTAEMIGFGAAVFNVTPGYPDHSTITGAYKVRVDIDDDPSFASPITLETDAIIDNLDILNNNPNSNADIFENQLPEQWLTYGYLHFTADTVINLQPNTTYTVRVYPYEDTRSGDDGWPTPHSYPEFVVWDDFSLKAISCAKIDAKADTPTSIDSNAGGSTPNVVINDELSGVANPTIGTAAGDVSLKRTGTAQDGTTTLGLDITPAAGSITMGTDGTITIVPNTTAGTYQYTYEICEAANSNNCDTAVATVVVDPSPLSPPVLSCSPTNLRDFTRTDLGSSNPLSFTTSDRFVFENVFTDTLGNPVDLLFQPTDISNVDYSKVPAQFNPGSGSLQGRFTPNLNSYIQFKVTLIEDGSATNTTPNGTPISAGDVTGLFIQQTDIDSNDKAPAPGDNDSSDVGGYIGVTPTYIHHYNTMLLDGSTAGLTFPTAGVAVAMNSAIAGSSATWTEEIGGTDFDNYVTYGFGSTFVTGEFLHGFTGSDTGDGTRGAGFFLCADEYTPSFSDLSVTKNLDTSGPYTSGQSVTYTLTVSNAGPDTATNVVVTDLPTNLTVTSASGTDSSCTISPASGVTTSVICSITTLEVGVSNNKTITIMATVP